MKNSLYVVGVAAFLFVSSAQADTRTFGSDYRFDCRKVDLSRDSKDADLAMCSPCERIRSGDLYAFGFETKWGENQSTWYQEHTSDSCWFERFKHDLCDHARVVDEYGNELVCKLRTDGKQKASCSECLISNDRAYGYYFEHLKYGIQVKLERFKSQDSCLIERARSCD